MTYRLQKVLAKVYQLYMVEYQCASILISHNQGTVEATVNAKPYQVQGCPHRIFINIFLASFYIR